MKRIFAILLLLNVSSNIFAQQCTGLGQTPETAFPVCGILNFNQVSVPNCVTTNVSVPGCATFASSAYSMKNPYFYKFTCYTSGPFNFTLTPTSPTSDYDWNLYDITGLTNINIVFQSNTYVVTGNWAGSYGPTGASASGVNFIQCGSDPAENRPTFARSPNLVAGRQYMLAVSHFSDNQSGYTLAFPGGVGIVSITDPADPLLKAASAPCDGTETRASFTKKIKCNTLASNGSDFEIVNASNVVIASATAAIGLNCNNGFDFDSVQVTSPVPLAAGTYKLRLKTGSDGNTLLDNCDKAIPVGHQFDFTVFPLLPTQLDSITKMGCAQDSLVLVFRKNMLCSTIAADGSDFSITGPSAVTITAAQTSCVNDKTAKIVLRLASPIVVGGNYTLNVRVGSDGNTLINECGLPTVLPNAVNFITKDTVNADFNFSIQYTCAANTVVFNHAGGNQIDVWNWNFGGNPPSQVTNVPTATAVYTNFRPQEVELTVSNGVCSDTVKKPIVFDNYIVAGFTAPDFVCPDKTASFVNNTIGNIVSWNWQFGNGNTSGIRNPFPQTYIPKLLNDYDTTVQLIATNNYGCSDTATKKIKVVNTCFIAVPNAFTPNGDGRNDFLYPLKAYLSRDLRFSIYNRLGQRVFFSTDWQRKWDGTFKGRPQDSGTYVWTLEYFSLEKNRQIFEKGTSILVR
jgi:gliding motility-associated-like protein